MKLLCLVQNFRQGWGGAPESIRLLARLLASEGYSVDVYDRGRLHSNVEGLELLPEPGAEIAGFTDENFGKYAAIMVVGPWQSPKSLRTIMRLRDPEQPLIYLPRGGLGRIEFARPRDIKKWPYFFLFERRILAASSAVVFSSECEQRHTVSAARKLAEEVVIPDFFESSTTPPAETEPRSAREVQFSFMAEISPRKGLLPLVKAFVDFASRPGFAHRVRLTVGGGVRKGSEAYLAEVRAAASACPDHAAIEFVGAVNHGDRQEFYAETDIFAVPSLFESYCLTILEALSAGCGSVAGPELGVLEYLPPHDRLSVAASTGHAHLVAALAEQFERAVQPGGPSRGDTVGYATDSIEALNRLAVERWNGLLRGHARLR